MKKYFAFLCLALCHYCISMSMPSKSFSGKPPQLTPVQVQMKAHLKKHVITLSKTIGKRNLSNYRGLHQAENYIKEAMQSFGYKIQTQALHFGSKSTKNIFTRIEGRDENLKKEILVFGAHYDSAYDTPGANDNASGVAVLLEMMRALKAIQFNRTVYFVAFTNEEPPYFRSEQMGSYVFAQKLSQEKRKVIGMVSLETMGFYSEKKNSQKYPWPFSWFYPSTGNFITFVANRDSKCFLFSLVKEFRKTASIASEGVSAPGSITGIDWSDHRSFWQFDFPGVMVTDTALFRYPHYHETSDTFEKLDYGRMARVTSGLIQAMKPLAN